MICYITHHPICYITHDLICYITHDLICYITHDMLCYITPDLICYELDICRIHVEEYHEPVFALSSRLFCHL